MGKAGEVGRLVISKRALWRAYLVDFIFVFSFQRFQCFLLLCLNRCE